MNFENHSTLGLLYHFWEVKSIDYITEKHCKRLFSKENEDKELTERKSFHMIHIINEKGEKMRYTQEQCNYIKSLDFMRLGQAINHEQWQSAAMIVRRMDIRAKEVELGGFERQFTGIRQCINRKEKAQAQQVLSVVISKRVQMMKQLQEQSYL